jgi:hypothetical protein
VRGSANHAGKYSVDGVSSVRCWRSGDVSSASGGIVFFLFKICICVTRNMYVVKRFCRYRLIGWNTDVRIVLHGEFGVWYRVMVQRSARSARVRPPPPPASVLPVLVRLGAALRRLVRPR